METEGTTKLDEGKSEAKRPCEMTTELIKEGRCSGTDAVTEICKRQYQQVLHYDSTYNSSVAHLVSRHMWHFRHPRNMRQG